jgi:chemotaxis protein histidine kinase CheA
MEQRPAESILAPTEVDPSGLDPSSVEEARRQIDALAAWTAALQDSPQPAAAMDEIYRSAHALKVEIDDMHLASTSRLARLVQDTVRALRSGRVPMSAPVAGLLESAARAAGESFEAYVSGRADAGAAENASAMLEGLLSLSPMAAAVRPAGDAGTAALVKVELRRIEAAEQAAGDSSAAAVALSGMALDAASVADAFRSMRDRQESLAKELLEALPDALSAVARGAPPTTLAGELARRVTALGAASADLEDSLLRFAGRVRDSAQSGTRAASRCADALQRLRLVRLETVFDGFAKSAARLAGQHAEITAEAGGLEIDSAAAGLVETTLRQCLRASIETPPGEALRIRVDARAEEEDVLITLLLEGNVRANTVAEEELAGLQTRLEKNGVSLIIESQRGARAVFSMSFQQLRSLRVTEGFMIGRAKETTYAIPVASIVKLIDARSMPPALKRGKDKLILVRLGAARTAHSGVLVREAGGKTVLLFDTLEGEEWLVAGPASDGSRAALRGDGSAARVLDVASFLSARRPRKRSATKKPRKEKR